MTLRWNLVLFTAVATTTAAPGQNLPGNSNPNGFATEFLGVYSLFVANDQAAGMELWRLDHLTGVVTLVRDIAPGAAGSNPKEITPFLSGFVFSAFERNTGVELWRSDGTASGTQQVVDIHPTASARPRDLTVVGTRLFFVADDGVNGAELWSYDGTSTALVRDIFVGGDSDPSDLIASGSSLLFTAYDGVHGRELWRSDGTLAGTQLVKDIAVGTAGSAPTGFVAMPGMALFTADDGLVGAELWRTDGSTAGTQLVKDIRPGPLGSVAGAKRFHIRTFFAATTAAEGRELWLTDGTTAGTSLVADLRPGPTGSDPSDLIGANLFDVWFVADDGVAGRELWRTFINGTGLVRKTDLVPGPGSVDPRDLVFLGAPDRIVFTDASGSPRLWAVDASPEGASPLGAFQLGPVGLTKNRSGIGQAPALFAADDATTGMEPWRTDGTSAGTALLANIAPDVAGWSLPSLDGHVDTSGTNVTVCIENGPALGIGVIGFGPSPGPPLFVPGVLDGPLLLASVLLTQVVLLDASGTGCITITLPATPSTADVVAQGFALDSVTGLPLSATDLCAIGVTSLSAVPLFGTTAKSVGVFCDEDHRYEVSVSLPPPTSGTYPTGKFVFCHDVAVYGGGSQLVPLEDHTRAYGGTATTTFLSGRTPMETINFLELWFYSSDGTKVFLWRSYC
jgi:ELWxxDGT repeat protein